MPNSKKDELRSLVADITKRKDAAQSLQAPSEIDWKSFENQIGAEEVAKIKKEYEAYKYTDFEQDISKEKSELEAKFADVKAQLSAQQEELAQFSQDAEAQLEETSVNYTTEDTTLEEVLQRYPDLDAKYDRQIENHDWDTDDVDSVDINAKKVAIIEERFDSSLHDGKKFDESVQKELLHEMDLVANKGRASSSSDGGAIGVEDLSPEIREHLDEIGELINVKYDDESLGKILEAAQSGLSESEKAVTDEATLFEMMDHYVSLGLTNKVDQIKAQYESLEASGSLVVDDEWRAAQQAKSASQAEENLGEFETSEIDGLSNDEVVALAEDAGERGEYWRASQILMEHYRRTGVVDDSNDLGSFSGQAKVLNTFASKLMGK